MQEIKAIIADDEDQLRSYLKSRLSDVWSDLVICGEARNGQEALELIDEHHPHIAPTISTQWRPLRMRPLTTF